MITITSDEKEIVNYLNNLWFNNDNNSNNMLYNILSYNVYYE